MQKLYQLWVVLMIVSGGVALGFLGVALANAWKYISLNEQTPVTILQVQVKEVASARFAIEAQYAYEINSVAYQGKTVFESPLFLNRFAAETYQLLVANKLKTAWYMKRNPALSTLENVFPYKRCLQALVTIGVFLYFYFARSLLARFISHLAKLDCVLL